jgi:secondary thiamine-phosphate synthase enzyme
MSTAMPVQQVAHSTKSVHTPGRGFTDITRAVRDAVTASGIGTGMVNVFVQHTSCSLLIGENADPTVRGDMERFFARLVPDGDPLFRHDAEGPDDMPAHIRSVLTGVSLCIPVHAAKPTLGTWQGIYLYEHRTAPHHRRVVIATLGH